MSKEITLKLNDERGEENREFDEAMKKNPPKGYVMILTEKGKYIINPDNVPEVVFEAKEK